MPDVPITVFYKGSEHMRFGIWHIGTFTGIPVKVHFTFLLVFALFAFPNVGREGFWSTFLWDSLFLVLLFTCVILHEFGHALMARRFGVGTREIVVLPIGGLALLDRLPEKPVQELFIALAGPAVNFAIALILSLYFVAFPLEDLLPYRYSAVSGAPVFAHPKLIVPFLVATNILLGIFNLLPAFPMDGGRVLRALLAVRMKRVRATHIASVTGQLFAIGFVVFSFYLSSPLMGIIGLFIFLAARRELKVAKTGEFLSTTMLRQTELPLIPVTLLDGMPLGKALAVFPPGHDLPLPVIDADGNVVGVADQGNILKIVGIGGADHPISSAASGKYVVLPSTATLQDAVEAIEDDTTIVVIHEDGSPLSVLTRASLGQLISASSA